MNYPELLNTIRKLTYCRVAVTGVPRSGVGFSSRCLSHDLGFNLVMPEVFAWNDYKLFIHNVCLRQRYVVACPGLLPYLHNMPGDVFIVVCNRNMVDVERSQSKVGIMESEIELDLYRQYRLTGNLNKCKMQFIERHIAPMRAFEYLEFESLKSHPLYVRPGEIAKSMHIATETSSRPRHPQKRRKKPHRMAATQR